MRLGRSVTKWVLGGLLMLLAEYARGAPVWVSTAIPSSVLPALFSYGIAADSRGELLTTFYDFRLPSHQIEFSGHTEGGEWKTEPLSIPKTLPTAFSADRLACFDHQDKPHVLLVNSLAIEYATKSGETWSTESVAFSTTKGIALALDDLSRPHVSFINVEGGADALYDGIRQSGVWSFQLIATLPSAALNKVTMDVDSNGTPSVACFSNPVRVYTRTNNVWNLSKSFPSPWAQPTLRIDAEGRSHLVLSSTAAAQARYLRWDSDGTVEIDQTIPLTAMAPVGASTDLEIDNAHQPHLLVGHVAIDPSGSFTELPALFINTKMVLVKGQFPFYMGTPDYSTPIVVLSTCIGGPPGQPQLMGMSTDSLTWSFLPSTGAVLGHRLINSDGMDISGLLDPSISTFTETGLAPNLSRQVFVRAIFPGMVRDSPLGPKIHSLTVPPQDIRLNRLAGNTLSVHWETGGNIPGTLYRTTVNSPQGDGVSVNTTLQSAQLFLDPAIPYAVTLAAVNGDGLETFVSSLTRTAQDGAGPAFSFEISNGLGVDMAFQGTGSGPALAVMVAPADSFPAAPASFGTFTSAGVGFDIPTNQAVPSGQAVSLTLRYPEGLLNASEPLTLARYDADKNNWIPLATQSDPLNRKLTASTRALGLFQVMVRTSQPSHVGNARVYPNPFHPALHNAMAIEEVPAGTQVRIYSDAGRLVQEFTTSDTNASWDARDRDGNLAHSGTYILRLEQNGETKRVRFVLER